MIQKFKETYLKKFVRIIYRETKESFAKIKPSKIRGGKV